MCAYACVPCWFGSHCNPMSYINNSRKESFVLADCFKSITVGVLVDTTACFMATRKQRACLQCLDFSLFPFDLPWTSPPGWCLLYSGLLFTHACARAHTHSGYGSPISSTPLHAVKLVSKISHHIHVCMWPSWVFSRSKTMSRCLH